MPILCRTATYGITRPGRINGQTIQVYPDYFVIGDLYTNVYEGSASLTDIRLYVPAAVQGSSSR